MRALNGDKFKNSSKKYKKLLNLFIDIILYVHLHSKRKLVNWMPFCKDQMSSKAT